MLTTSQSQRNTLSVPDSICVAVHARAAETLFSLSRRLLPEYRFQELRLDYLPDPASSLPALAEHLRQHPESTFLITCRTQANGGQWLATADDELALLTSAAHRGAQWLDLSLESAEALGPIAVEGLRQAGARLLISWHDFHQTGDLRAVLERMRPLPADLRKLVPTAQTLTDCISLFKLFQEREADTPMVGIAMGEAGMPTRILGPRSGSAFTFAAPDSAEGALTAPGQIDAATLRSLYRVDRLTPATRVFGVAGDPIRSSLSPLMLNTAFATARIDAVDIPLLTGSAAELFRFARALELAGCSVTMPLKQTILPLVDHLDPLAARVGAVNTLRREADGSYTGYNTDTAGITLPLAQRIDLRGARILVVGAGGAARAAVFGCLAEGADVSILNRTYESAAKLAAESGARALRTVDLAAEPAFDALIQSTPAGMHGQQIDSSFALESVDVRLVFDLVYNPLETPLLRAARERGLAVIPGVEMFVHQGARQFELWTGQPAPTDAMRQVVLQALKDR